MVGNREMRFSRRELAVVPLLLMNRLSGLAKLLQITFGAGLYVALVLGIGYAYRQAATDFELGWGSALWTVHHVMERELQRETQLEDRSEDMRRRHAAKEWVKQELIAQRMTLWEAASHFRDLSKSEPWYLEQIRKAYPGRSDEESLCRNVIAYVRVALTREPARAAVVLARLEAELRELMEGYDTSPLQPTELSDRKGGKVGLWVSGVSGSEFANLKITPSTAQKTLCKDDFVDKSPHQSAFITVNGVKLHHLDWGGKGKPLLFLTGLGHSAHIYDDLAPKFVDEFRVLALTWRGHGQSDKPEMGYDVDTLTEDVRQFLNAMKLERVTLVGYSMAGEELTRFAGLYPERVDRLVYLDAAYDRTDPSFRASRGKAPDVFALLNPTPQDLASIDALRNFSKKARGGWSAAVEADWRETLLYSPEGKPLGSVTSAKIIGLVAKGYRPPDYTKVKAPALSFYALPTMESAFPWITPDVNAEVRKQAQNLLETDMIPRQRRQIEQFRKGVANARVIEMPNTRHDCFIDKQDEVVREMCAFLSGK